MWINSINGKRYIGSAVDLPYRMSFYFSEKAMGNFRKKKKAVLPASQAGAHKNKQKKQKKKVKVIYGVLC